MNERPRDPNEDPREVERLRKEVKRLNSELAHNKEKNAPVPGGPPTRPRHYGRRVTSGVLLVIGLILLLVTIPTIWLERTILTTDGWVDAVGPLAEDPAVQDAVAGVAATQFIEGVNVEQWIQEQLPEQNDALAAPLTILIEAGITQLIGAIVESDAFAGIWRDANRISHSLALAGYARGEELLEATDGGNVVIDLGAIIERLQQELARLGIEIPLPEDFSSQVTVFQSQQLPAFFSFINILDTAAPILALAAFLVLAAAVAIPPDRRRVVLFLGIGVAVVGVLLLITDAIVKWQLVRPVGPFPLEAVSQAYDSITNELIVSLRAFILVGLFLWLGAFALGPSHSMVSARHRIRDWIHSLGYGRNPNRQELWIGAHRQAIQVVVLILAGIALVIPYQRTIPFVLVLVAIVALLEFAVEYLGRTPPPVAH